MLQSPIEQDFREILNSKIPNQVPKNPKIKGESIETIAKLKQEYQFNHASVGAQLVLNLLDKSADKMQLVGEKFI